LLSCVQSLLKQFYQGKWHICFRYWGLIEWRSKWNFFVTYCIHWCQICTMLPNTHFNMAEMQCRLSLRAFMSNCKVWEMSRGAVHSGCFNSTTQRWDLVRWRRAEAYTNINEITTNKGMYIAFYCLKMNIQKCAGRP
jgi:hypothetical protein